MRSGTRHFGVLLAAVFLVGAACSGGHSSSNGSSSSKTGTVKVPPVRDGDLRPVVDTWLRRNHTPGVVVGVRTGTAAPVFVGSGISETTALPIGDVADALIGAAARRLSDRGDLPLDATIDRWLPRLANARRITVRDLLTRRPFDAKLLGLVVAAAGKTDLATALQQQVLGPFGMHDTSYAPTATRSSARDLLAFSAGYLRARVRGAHDLGTSAFAVGPTGAGLGVDGVANDGVCVSTRTGCAHGVVFFAVGAAGSTPGGSGVVVYDPVYDVSVVVLVRSGAVAFQDLALRADLLAKVGKAVYDKTVGFTPRTVSSTVG